MRIVIIEDDRAVVETIMLAFQVGWPGSEVIPSRLGLAGVELIEIKQPDIVILDLGLPDISGFEVLKQIRLFSSVPVIILSVRGEEEDIIKGLELGADEYITKPFRQFELIARVRALLRRQNTPIGDVPFVFTNHSFYPCLRKIVSSNKTLFLTSIENQILWHLLNYKGQIVTHQSLARHVWGDDFTASLDVLRVHIRHLREKIEENPSAPEHILTITGIGYKFIS